MNDGLYFEWLCDLVHVDNGFGTYYKLAYLLFDTEFKPMVGRDDNRALDGIQLREEYDEAFESQYDVYSDEFIESPCSMLELVIGLARRMEFELSGVEYEEDKTSTYFWELLENANLTTFDDDYFGSNDEGDVTEEIFDILDKINEREYSANGEGGFFPLKSPKADQRDVELWYQMQAYIYERYGV